MNQVMYEGAITQSIEIGGETSKFSGATETSVFASILF